MLFTIAHTVSSCTNIPTLCKNILSRLFVSHRIPELNIIFWLCRNLCIANHNLLLLNFYHTQDIYKVQVYLMSAVFQSVSNDCHTSGNEFHTQMPFPLYDHCSHEVCTFSLSFQSHPGSVHPSDINCTFSVHILQYNKNGTHSAMFLPYSVWLMEIP